MSDNLRHERCVCSACERSPRERVDGRGIFGRLLDREFEVAGDVVEVDPSGRDRGRVQRSDDELNSLPVALASMKYAECPTTTVSIDVATSPAAVWALVSDIGLPSRFSTEVSGAEWLDGADGPALGARFVGHSAHDAIGEWSTTCIVTDYVPEHVFEWSVIGRDDDVSSIWRYTITDRGAGRVDLDFWFQMGPGRGGLNYAIERMPDKEERIVARRMEEHRANMERVVAGVKALAESAGPTP